MNLDAHKLSALMVCIMIGIGVERNPSRAEEADTQTSFRVVTTIFAGSAREPSAKHLVLFHEGLVYDLPQIHDGQVTVYDLQRDRVILLDRETQVRSTVTNDELMKLTAQLRAQAMAPQAKQQLGVDAVVQKSDDLGGYSISYGSLRYDTSTQIPSQESIAKRYGQFADLASQLNIARAVGMPPIGRMTMNRQIADDGRMPDKTQLTINQIGNRKTFRSTHELIEKISQDDRNRIDEVGNMLALYQEVDLRDFPK